mmetsp:Transcript_6913/g.9558  ORF Transcript_6913/g.9558 Transcript_6913/m.9558 type:complete len:203 (-) Transcript_6913:142-750(-)
MADNHENEHNEQEDQDNYKVSKKVAIDDIMKMDQEDESMKKYKESLLGQAANQVFAPKDDPRRVVIEEMRVICEGRPGGDIVYTLDKKEAIDKMKENPFILKEGCNYKIQIKFRVQHELVLGLKYVSIVSRGPVKEKGEIMIGSYAPQQPPYSMTYPRIGWDEAPKGMISRGKYKAKSQFIDDDKQVHLEYEYAFEIKKDWD